MEEAMMIEEKSRRYGKSNLYAQHTWNPTTELELEKKKNPMVSLNILHTRLPNE